MPDERTTLKREIDAYLKTLAPNVWFRKKWGGGIYGNSGDSDYTVCAWGRFGVIEAKHPIKKPKLKPDQVFYQKEIVRAGGFVIEATSVGEIQVAFERLFGSDVCYE
jgi:hypothetical protein